MNDDARRDRVAAAIHQALHITPGTTCDELTWTDIQIADAAIVAYENEPEPTRPQLIEDMAEAIREARDFCYDHRIDQARAALGVVCKRLNKSCVLSGTMADILGIPESLVRSMLDE